MKTKRSTGRATNVLKRNILHVRKILKKNWSKTLTQWSAVSVVAFMAGAIIMLFATMLAKLAGAGNEVMYRLLRITLALFKCMSAAAAVCTVSAIAAVAAQKKRIKAKQQKKPERGAQQKSKEKGFWVYEEYPGAFDGN